MALRTLRQVPNVVDKTEGGHPVFEVRNVRMVLPGDANHFSRLVTCTNCRREVAGLPILSPADLDHAPGPLVCTDCVQALRTQGAPPPLAPAPNGELDQLRAHVKELEATGQAAAHAAHAESVTLRLAVDESLAVMDGKVQAQLQELHAALRDGLADVRAVAAVPADVTERLQELEKQTQRSGAEVAELGELHAALDAGMGALRTEIAEVRSAVMRVADGQADLDDRLETYVRASLALDTPGKGRRSGRKGAGADRMTTVTAAIEGLLGEQRQVKEQLASLAQASEVASTTAARAASQASALRRLRGEVELLHQEIAEQNETIETLRTTVERARAAAPARASAGKRAPAKKNKA